MQEIHLFASLQIGNFNEMIKVIERCDIEKQQITSLSLEFMHKNWKLKILDIIFGMQKLKKIKKLRISNSNVSVGEIKGLFYYLELQSLEQMDLSSNNNTIDTKFLSQVAMEINQLQSLNLQNNRKIDFTSICSLIPNCKLTYLNLSNTCIDGQSLRKINELFPNLKELVINKNYNIQDWDALKNYQFLESLQIANCTLTQSQLETIFQQNYKNHLNLSGTTIQFEDENKDISCLILSNKENFKFLQKLTLESSNLISGNIKKVFQLICFENLNAINFKNNHQLSPDSFKYFQIQGLQQLFLDNCNITEKSLKYITKNSLQNLEILSLNENFQLSDQGIKILQDINLINLKILNLANCNISDIGVKSLVQNKYILSNLEELNLRENSYVKNQGASILINEEFSKLIYLNLSGCQINDETISLLMQWKSIHHIEDLRIGQNPITLQSIDCITQNLDHLKSMKKISVGSISDCIENQTLFYNKNIYIIPFVGDDKD